MKKPVKILIVDDEPLARRRIRMLLENLDNLELVGEVSNGRSAIEFILNKQPDLVFLDIQMPELNGFEVIKAIGVSRMPAVIFVTAYDRYAIEAFEIHAVDYLLKPFDKNRFLEALKRGLYEIKNRRWNADSDKIQALVNSLVSDDFLDDRVLVKTAGKIIFIRTDQIDWIESAGNYVNLHAGKENYLIRETMKKMESRLNPKIFVRIHRAVLVNIARIREISYHGGCAVTLHNGNKLPLSRKYRSNLARLLKQ
jgi:two-component system LytT family response regulator